MLKFIVISRKTDEVAIARERAENRRRPRFLSHSWHGSPTPPPSITVEEVKNIIYIILNFVTKFFLLYLFFFYFTV